jgi:hypothetical protein
MPHGAKPAVVERVASDLKMEVGNALKEPTAKDLFHSPAKSAYGQLRPKPDPIDSQAASGTCFKHVRAVVASTVADRFKSMRHGNNHALSPI